MREALASQNLEPARESHVIGHDCQRCDLTIGVLQLPAVQEHELDVQAEAAAQHLSDVEQQLLRPAGKCVVTDQQQFGRHHIARQAADSSAGRIEVGGAKMQVGLKVGALAPLVPGIHADDRLPKKRPFTRHVS